MAPPGVEPVSSTARWSVDPTGRHRCRYWDGAAWTQHVADAGTLGTDPAPKVSGWSAEKIGALVAGLITVALLAAAGADIWVQLSRDAAKPATVAASTTTTSTEPAAPPPPAVVATACQPGGGNGLAADGSVTYCERLANTDRFLWSVNPGDIPTPEVGQDADPAVGVCMVQTGRGEAECIEYLKPPSGTGN